MKQLYQLQKRLAKWRQRFVTNVFKNSVCLFVGVFLCGGVCVGGAFFWQKSKFCTIWSIRFVSNFVNMWSKYVSNIMYGETLDFSVSI